MTPPITLSSEQMVDAIVKVLANDDRVIFAYLYGSMVFEGKGNDIDIAVFPDGQADSYQSSVSVKDSSRRYWREGRSHPH